MLMEMTSIGSKVNVATFYLVVISVREYNLKFSNCITVGGQLISFLTGSLSDGC